MDHVRFFDDLIIASVSIFCSYTFPLCKIRDISLITESSSKSHRNLLIQHSLLTLLYDIKNHRYLGRKIAKKYSSSTMIRSSLRASKGCQMICPRFGTLGRSVSMISPRKAVLSNRNMSTEVSDAIPVDVISQLKTLKNQHTTNKSEKSSKEYLKVIGSAFTAETLNLNQEVLRQLLLLKLPVDVNLKLIEVHYSQGNGPIPRDISLIALRSALYDAEYEKAIALTDATVAHPKYIAHRDSMLRRGIFRLIATSLGITVMSKFGINALIEVFNLNDGWRHLSSINLMILTYVINSSFFVTAVRFGRQVITAGGDYLTWQQGTFYTHWFRHADELLFASKIVELDRLLNGGESTPKLLAELTRAKEENIFVVEHTLQPGMTRDGKVRLLKARDDLGDLRMQAYWMSGGDGFEWVEPDQDPAELIWRDYLGEGLIESRAKELALEEGEEVDVSEAKILAEI